MRTGPEEVTVRAVLLDWDGTLLDSYHADTQAYLEMFQELGIGWGVAELARHYSPDGHRAYRAAGLPRNRWEQADRLWGRFYQRQNPALLPGARRGPPGRSPRITLGFGTRGSRVRACRHVPHLGPVAL